MWHSTVAEAAHVAHHSDRGIHHECMGRKDMEKRLKQYIVYLESLGSEHWSKLTEEQKQEKLESARLQIAWFQHERLVHLIVTMTFAVMMVMSIIGGILAEYIPLFILGGAFLILLAPYIRHYYILENGVQQMYRLYDKLADKNDGISFSN